MASRKSLLPREGFTVDVLFKLLEKTVLSPATLLSILLAGRYTKNGENLSILHPIAFRRIKYLFYIQLARWLSQYYSKQAINNWTKDKYDWSREIVLVTGGSGGIGGHVVQMLARQGIKVVVLDIQPLTFQETPNIHYFSCDLTSPASVANAANAIRSRVGDPTVLINNAGVVRGTTVLDSTERSVRFTFDVNLLSQFRTIREFVPAMVRANHGMVVTVASGAAWLAAPRMADYAASKAGAVSLHEALAAELVARHAAPKVRTVLVCPGLVKTKLFTGFAPSSGFFAPSLEPETLAEAIVEQVLSGRSGQLLLPGIFNLIKATAMMPLWYQTRLRLRGDRLMTEYKGRQVVEDLDTFYAERDRESSATEGSTVLVTQGD